VDDEGDAGVESSAWFQQGSDAASVLIRPGYEWRGDKPGQYVRLGVIIDGV
jgi:hypothetical protein